MVGMEWRGGEGEGRGQKKRGERVKEGHSRSLKVNYFSITE